MKDILVYLLVALAMVAGIVVAAINPAFAQTEAPEGWVDTVTPSSDDASGHIVVEGFAPAILALTFPGSSDLLKIEIALPNARPAMLMLTDDTGRTIWAYDVGFMGSGIHTLPITTTEYVHSRTCHVSLRQAGRSASAVFGPRETPESTDD